MRTLSLSIAAVCLLAAPVCAQTQGTVTVDQHNSIADLGAGVAIQGPADVNQPPRCEELGLPCLSPRTFPDFGIAMLGTVYPAELVGIAGELAAYANPWYGYGTACPPAGGAPSSCSVREVNHIRAALVGLRVRTPVIEDAGSRWRLFGQMLAGRQWTDVTPTRHVLQPGVGADDYLRNGVTLHVEYSYTFAPSDGRDLSTGRFLVGLALPVGAR